MPLSTRLPTLLAALALSVVAVAGCGGSDEPEAAEVPADAIAVVGDRAIPKTEYDRLLAQAQATYEAREQDFPAAGTPEFAQLRNSIVRSLVEQTQFEIAAEERDLTVTDDELQKRLENGTINLAVDMDPKAFVSLGEGKGQCVAKDLGVGYGTWQLFGNMNLATAADKVKVSWLINQKFREFLSRVVDRDAIVKEVYAGKAAPAFGPVTPANQVWHNGSAKKIAFEL